MGIKPSPSIDIQQAVADADCRVPNVRIHPDATLGIQQDADNALAGMYSQSGLLDRWFGEGPTYDGYPLLPSPVSVNQISPIRNGRHRTTDNAGRTVSYVEPAPRKQIITSPAVSVDAAFPAGAPNLNQQVAGPIDLRVNASSYPLFVEPYIEVRNFAGRPPGQSLTRTLEDSVASATSDQSDGHAHNVTMTHKISKYDISPTEASYVAYWVTWQIQIDTNVGPVERVFVGYGYGGSINWPATPYILEKGIRSNITAKAGILYFGQVSSSWIFNLQHFQLRAIVTEITSEAPRSWNIS